MLGPLTDQEIEAVLLGQAIGRIGCHAEGRTYVVPITYVYEGGAIYAHSGEGQKLRMMRAQPEVCFEVEEIEDLARWRSVVAHGTFEELHGADAARAMGLLLTRLAPRMVSETARPTHGTTGHPAPDGEHRRDTQGHAAVLYRIVLRHKTGRYERR